MITHILFDVDNTLLDYRATEHAVAAQIFADSGKQLTEEISEELWKISWKYWHEQHLEETHRKDVQREYAQRYKIAVTKYYAEMSERYGLGRSGEELFARGNELTYAADTEYDDVAPTLEALRGRYVLCAASNNIAKTQRERLKTSGLPIDHVFISEEIGAMKPDAAFFAHILAHLGVDAGDCMMVGDSLTSDILGAKEAGMVTVFLDRAGKSLIGEKRPDSIVPDYTIEDLRQLIDILKQEEKEHVGI